eukprot:TRINITY_DN39721_c0_g1_i1.p1 TRINITY_DN39721_c0_g1~~TRINITY_DN39721_c0_g1_i1.p1  ORF type:complete len:1296 (+),score=479.63 TRINITY_DN39721_c0_g1_i1:74-3889(+)
MALGPRVAKLAELLSTGEAPETARGLQLLREELDDTDGAALVDAFLAVSPALSELTQLIHLDGASSVDAVELICKCATLRTHSRMAAAITNVLSERCLVIILQWVRGERGDRSCMAGLHLLTRTNIIAPGAVAPRIKLATVLGQGPWTADTAKADVKDAFTRARVMPVRKRGVEFLLSFLAPLRDEGGGMDVASVEAVIDTAGYFYGICATAEYDAEDTLQIAVETLSALLSTPSLPRSLRARVVERRGVAALLSRAAMTFKWAEVPVTHALLMIVVPEGDALLASQHPNRALRHVLCQLEPEAHVAHRRIVRRCLERAPDLVPAVAEKLLSKSNAISSDAQQMFVLQTLVALLEAPLPMPLREASGRLVPDAAPVSSFDITPGTVVDLCLPHRTNLVLLSQKHTWTYSGILSLQVATTMAVTLQRLMLVERAVRRIAKRSAAMRIGTQDTTPVVNPDEFITRCRLEYVNRMPPRMKAVYVILPHPHPSEPLTPASAYLYDCTFTLMRWYSHSLPQYELQALGRTLYPRVPAEAEHWWVDLSRPLVDMPSLLDCMPHTTAYLLLQTIINDPAFSPNKICMKWGLRWLDDTIDHYEPAGAEGENPNVEAEDGKKRKNVTHKQHEPYVPSIISDVIVYHSHARRAADAGAPGAAEAAAACESLLHTTMAAVSCVGWVCPLGVPNQRVLAGELLRACSTAGHAYAVGLTIEEYILRITLTTEPFAKKVPPEGTPSLWEHVAQRVERKYRLWGYEDMVKGCVEAAATTQAWKRYRALPHVLPDGTGMPELRPASVETFWQRRKAGKGQAAVKEEEGVSGDLRLLRQYRGTLSAADRQAWPQVKKLLRRSAFRAGPGTAFDEQPHALWIQTGLVELLTPTKITATVNSYPPLPSAGPTDDADLVDPRFVSEVTAAHLLFCAKKGRVRVPGFDPRRLSHTGLIPMLIMGLSSRDPDVRRTSAAGCAALLRLVDRMDPLRPVLVHCRNSVPAEGAKLRTLTAAFLAAACGRTYRPDAAGMVMWEYLLKHPRTETSMQLPLLQYILCPAGTAYGSTTAALGYVRCGLQSLSHPLWPEGAPAEEVGELISLSRDGAVAAALAVITLPTAPDSIRDHAIRLLEAIPGAGAGQAAKDTAPLLVTLVTAATKLAGSAAGDVRAVVAHRNWEHRTRLASVAGALAAALPADTAALMQQELVAARDGLLFLANSLRSTAAGVREGALLRASLGSAADAHKRLAAPPMLPAAVLSALRSVVSAVWEDSAEGVQALSALDTLSGSAA